MSEHKGPDDDAGTAEPADDMEALQAHIEEVRADLADTVDELAARLDVKTRVRDRAREVSDNAVLTLHKVRDRVTDDHGRPAPNVVIAGGGAVAAGVAVVVVALWRRNNSTWRRRLRRDYLREYRRAARRGRRSRRRERRGHR